MKADGMSPYKRFVWLIKDIRWLTMSASKQMIMITSRRWLPRLWTFF